MLLTAEEIPIAEIPTPQEDPERAEEAARFILKNLYREDNPSARRLREQLTDMDRRTTIAAFDGDLMVATGSLEIGLPTEAKLEDMAVRDDYKRIGLGSMIVSRIEAMAAQAGAEEIRFMSAITSVAFYQKLGYSVHDVIFCQKALRPAD
ncbi:MAG TPA: GNAT family N-acetyltransferase [Candidatus Saccharimonadales bacterium]|nr:GNAT family N-acetyltransferase [Candidatus Saccharimonadales bacterium]